MPTPFQRMVPSRSSSTTNPLPKFEMPRLPDKIANIDPALRQWEQAVAEKVQEHFRLLEDKLNTVIDAQKSGQ